MAALPGTGAGRPAPRPPHPLPDAAGPAAAGGRPPRQSALWKTAKTQRWAVMMFGCASQAASGPFPPAASPGCGGGQEAAGALPAAAVAAAQGSAAAASQSRQAQAARFPPAPASRALAATGHAGAGQGRARGQRGRRERGHPAAGGGATGGVGRPWGKGTWGRGCRGRVLRAAAAGDARLTGDARRAHQRGWMRVPAAVRARGGFAGARRLCRPAAAGGAKQRRARLFAPHRHRCLLGGAAAGDQARALVDPRHPRRPGGLCQAQ
jgi:hypothetical protein